MNSRLPWSEVERSLGKLTSKTIKPLKPKHVAIVTNATFQREIPVGEMLRFLFARIREGHWVALIVVQILMKDGDAERVYSALKANTAILNMSVFRDRSSHPLGIVQTKNIRNYAAYLEDKVNSWVEVTQDFVTKKDDVINRFRTLAIGDELLGEIQILQRQINSLLSCSFYSEGIDNVVTLQAFRLLVGDMMILFHLLNEAVIRILANYFEMSKQQATRSLSIYKAFAEQTVKINQFFDISRRLRYQLGIDVPDFKHPPLSLANALETYLNAPDFEAQREIYKNRKAESEKKETALASTPKSATSQPKQAIDFFSSLDDEINAFKQVSTAQQAAFQQTNFNQNWYPDQAQFEQQGFFNPNDHQGNQMGTINSTYNPYSMMNQSNMSPMTASSTTETPQSAYNPFAMQMQPQVQNQQQNMISMMNNQNIVPSQGSNANGNQFGQLGNAQFTVDSVFGVQANVPHNMTMNSNQGNFGNLSFQQAVAPSFTGTTASSTVNSMGQQQPIMTSNQNQGIMVPQQQSIGFSGSTGTNMGTQNVKSSPADPFAGLSFINQATGSVANNSQLPVMSKADIAFAGLDPIGGNKPNAMFSLNALSTMQKQPQQPFGLSNHPATNTFASPQNNQFATPQVQQQQQLTQPFSQSFAVTSAPFGQTTTGFQSSPQQQFGQPFGNNNMNPVVTTTTLQSTGAFSSNNPFVMNSGMGTYGR